MDGTMGSPESALWARVPGHLSPSAATLAIVGDYVSGAVSQPIGRRAMGRSLDNTLRMVQLKPTEWILCDIRIHALVGGYAQGIAFSGRKTASFSLPRASQLGFVSGPKTQFSLDNRAKRGGDGIPRPRNGDNWHMARAGAATRKSARSVPLILCLILAALAVGRCRHRKDLVFLHANFLRERGRDDVGCGESQCDPSVDEHEAGSGDHHHGASADNHDAARPAAGFVPGRVTAVGDSVMLDYQDPLHTDIPAPASMRR